MQLYTNDNPKTTIKGLGFKNKKTAIETIKIVEEVFNNMMKNQKIFRILGMRNRAKGMLNRVKNNKDLCEAIKIFDIWLNKNKKLIK